MFIFYTRLVILVESRNGRNIIIDDFKLTLAFLFHGHAYSIQNNQPNGTKSCWAWNQVSFYDPLVKLFYC
jgi:hypothetical protein